MIGLSTYLLLDPTEESYFDLTKDDIYLQYGKIFLLVSGALMLLGGILGCCGGFRQSSACLSLVSTSGTEFRITIISVLVIFV